MTDVWLKDKPVMTAALVKRLMAAAEGAVTEHGFAMYVAIVDEAGTPQAVERINGAQPASFTISIKKAECAARFRRATKVWEERVKTGAPNVMTLPGVIASEGGVPLVARGTAIGAVGVSGGTGVEDGVIAAAVVAALDALSL